MSRLNRRNRNKRAATRRPLDPSSLFSFDPTHHDAIIAIVEKTSAGEAPAANEVLAGLKQQPPLAVRAQGLRVGL
jgi:hypothetical protein